MKHTWTKEESLQVLHIYLMYPKGSAEFKQAINELSQLTGIPERSIRLRLRNYKFLDTDGKSGMSHVATVDKDWWSMYKLDAEDFWNKSNDILNQKGEAVSLDKCKYMHLKYCDIDCCDREALTRVRTNQYRFREMVLANYANKCALSGINMPGLLVASHIIPWKANKHRMDPENGICLSALYDKAFDQGFISFDNDYRCIISPRLKATVSNDVFKVHFSWLEKRMMDFPIIHKPNPDYLAWHREHVFVSR